MHLKIEEISTSVSWFLNAKNGLAPEYLAELFSSYDTVHMYNTHNTSQLLGTQEPEPPITTAVLQFPVVSTFMHEL